MDEFAIEQYILGISPDVQTSEAFGYRFFFFGDDHRMPFATLISSDSEYDKFSNLDRPGVYRLNIGVGKATFQSLFGTEEISPSDYDLTELDRFMPHPDYARQYFLCILSPGEANLPKVKELLSEANAIAERRAKARSAT